MHCAVSNWLQPTSSHKKHCCESGLPGLSCFGNGISLQILSFLRVAEWVAGAGKREKRRKGEDYEEGVLQGSPLENESEQV